MKKIIETIIKSKVYITLFIISIILLITVIGIGAGKIASSKAKIITSSTLTEIIKTSKISGAQFVYNGIAEVYKNEESRKVKCYVKYDAQVTARVDLEKVNIEVDDEAKKVKVILPELELDTELKDNSFSFISKNNNVEISEIILACKEDAKKEAKQSKEFIDSAKQNIMKNITTYIYGTLKANGYELAN